MSEASMREKLTAALSPEMLEIIDDSESHRGHGGFREGGGTHFNVHIVASAFEGQTRIARQRSVFAVLTEEMHEHIHALSLVCQTPAEAARAATNG